MSFHSAQLEGQRRNRNDPLRVTVDGRALWAPGEAIDGPHRRRDAADPALAEDAAAA